MDGALLVLIESHRSVRNIDRVAAGGDELCLDLFAVGSGEGNQGDGGDLVGVTPWNVVPTNNTLLDLLGVYPTVETLTPQIVLVALALISMFIAVVRARRGAKAA